MLQEINPEIEKTKNCILNYYKCCNGLNEKNAPYFVKIVSLYSKNFYDYAENYMLENSTLSDSAKELAYNRYMMKLEMMAEKSPDGTLGKFIQNFIRYESGKKLSAAEELLQSSVKKLFFLQAGL